MAGSDATVRGDFAALLEELGRRWALRVIWELRDGELHFTELRKNAGGLSQSVLVTRLGDLTAAGLVRDAAGGYELTARGVELSHHLRRIADWADDARDAQSTDGPAGPAAAPVPASPPVPPVSASPPVPPRPTPGASARPRPRPRPAP